jgi:hypothetical protein
MKRFWLYAKKYGWIAIAILAAAVGIFFASGRRKKPVLRPKDLDAPLPGLDVAPDPELPDEPEVDSRPFARYLAKASEIDKQIADDRVAAAARRYK